MVRSSGRAPRRRRQTRSSSTLASSLVSLNFRHGGPAAVTEPDMATLNLAHCHLSSASRALQPITVERHGADDHQTLDHILPYVGNPGEDEAIRQNGNDQGPDQRSPDRADTADEGGATQDNSGDRVELVGLAELQPIGSIEARRLHGPAKPGQQPRHPIDEDQHSPDLDAGQTCRTLVTADRIDMHPEHGATQYQPRFNVE